MSDCTHRYEDSPTGLICTGTNGHAFGHTYAASDAPDGHTVSEDAAERGRG